MTKYQSPNIALSSHYKEYTGELKNTWTVDDANRRDCCGHILRNKIRKGDILMHANKEPKIHVVFTRSSVCMGDDIEEHKVEIPFNKQDSWELLLSKIQEIKFLPYVWGNDVVWVLETEGQNEILSYFTKQGKLYKATTKTTVGEICKETYKLHFKYYSSPLKRGKYIFDLYNGNQYHMYHDGWIEEYKSCGVSKEIEESWK